MQYLYLYVHKNRKSYAERGPSTSINLQNTMSHLNSQNWQSPPIALLSHQGPRWHTLSASTTVSKQLPFLRFVATIVLTSTQNIPPPLKLLSRKKVFVTCRRYDFWKYVYWGVLIKQSNKLNKSLEHRCVFTTLINYRSLQHIHSK